MQIGFSLILFIIGACLGSFLCCQARRLHLKTVKHRRLGSRSVCLNCNYQLRWYDNIPIFSWLLLGGKCRKCHHSIGWAEFISEFGLGLAFLFLSSTIKVTTAGFFDWAILVSTLILMASLGFLAIYDGAYGELPSLYLIISIILAIVTLILKEWAFLSVRAFTPTLVWEPLLSILILGGLYLLLYLLSRGKWVGDGDWLLGTAIAIALFKPWLALNALFIANVIACLVMYPQIKSKPSRKVYFGPFLVLAFVITYTFADFFLAVL